MAKQKGMAGWESYAKAHKALSRFQAKFNRSFEPSNLELEIPPRMMEAYYGLLMTALVQTEAKREEVESNPHKFNTAYFLEGLAQLYKEEQNALNWFLEQGMGGMALMKGKGVDAPWKVEFFPLAA